MVLTIAPAPGPLVEPSARRAPLTPGFRPRAPPATIAPWGLAARLAARRSVRQLAWASPSCSSRTCSRGLCHFVVAARPARRCARAPVQPAMPLGVSPRESSTRGTCAPFRSPQGSSNAPASSIKISAFTRCGGSLAARSALGDALMRPVRLPIATSGCEHRRRTGSSGTSSASASSAPSYREPPSPAWRCAGEVLALALHSSAPFATRAISSGSDTRTKSRISLLPSYTPSSMHAARTRSCRCPPAPAARAPGSRLALSARPPLERWPVRPSSSPAESAPGHLNRSGHHFAVARGARANREVRCRPGRRTCDRRAHRCFLQRVALQNALVVAGRLLGSSMILPDQRDSTSISMRRSVVGRTAAGRRGLELAPALGGVQNVFEPQEARSLPGSRASTRSSTDRSDGRPRSSSAARRALRARPECLGALGRHRESFAISVGALRCGQRFGASQNRQLSLISASAANNLERRPDAPSLCSCTSLPRVQPRR